MYSTDKKTFYGNRCINRPLFSDFHFHKYMYIHDDSAADGDNITNDDWRFKKTNK